MTTDGTSVPVAFPPTCRTGTAILTIGNQAIRYVMRSGTPWLSGSDLARALNLAAERSPGPWVRGLPETERGHADMSTLQGPQRLTIVSVFGALQLASRNNRPIDLDVREFLTAKVLPLCENAKADVDDEFPISLCIAALRHLANRLERAEARYGQIAQAVASTFSPDQLP